MPKVRGRKMVNVAPSASDGKWWERATGGNWLKLKPGKYALKITFPPRERTMKYGKQKPRPVLDIATSGGTITVGLQSSLAAFLGQYVDEKGGNPQALKGRTLTFRVTGQKLSREFHDLKLA
jgi:hypothetical protein